MAGDFFYIVLIQKFLFCIRVVINETVDDYIFAVPPNRETKDTIRILRVGYDYGYEGYL